MATLAPYSAKRTAIACPMPELPPVTRTFLPFSPGMASTVGWALASVSDMKAPLSKCPLVRATAEALHPPPHPSERKRGGARRGEVDPEVAEVAEDQSGPLAACGVEARAGRGRTEPDQRDEERQDHQRAPAREHRDEQRNGHARLEGDRGGDRDRRVRHGPADRMHHRPWEQGLGEPGARGGASELGGDVARGIAWRHPPERPEAERDGGVEMGARTPPEGRQGDARHDGSDERPEREEAPGAEVERGGGRDQDRGHQHGGAGRLGAPTAPADGGVLAHGYIATSGAGSASDC